MPGERLSAAEGPGTLCAIYAELDDATGLAKKVLPIRLGGALLPTPLPG
jgi:calcineurin-like phosphoesterase